MGRLRIASACLAAGLVLSGVAAPASAAISTYRWQVQQAGPIGSSGYTANWPAPCGSQISVESLLVVTTMSTAAFCGDDRYRNRNPAGPHDMLLLVRDTAYATSTTVTGQAAGNRWRLEDDSGGGKTFRLSLGYAQGGTFTAWGFIDLVVPDGQAVLFQPDMSAISGTAPGGSHLALQVTKQVGASGSRVVIHFADNFQAGDDSAELTVDEVAAGNTTTLGDGTDPAASSMCPGDPEAVASEFTFQTDGNTDAVNDLTVTLSPAGSFNNLSQVRITSQGGGTQYGLVNSPASDTVPITLTNLDATAGGATFEVRLTPKTDAGMPAPPGASYDVTAPVTAFTPANNTAAGSDNDTEATTVDNASPANAAWGTITPGDDQIELAWTDPGDVDFAEVIIVRRLNAPVTGTPTEGTTYIVGNTLDPGDDIVFVGTDAASPWTDTGVSNGQSYWYEIFARDAPCTNWSIGSATGPHTPQAPANEVTPGTPTATSVQCDSVTIEAPFTGDTNGNSTTDFARKAGSNCAGGGYSPVTGCTGIAGASPRVCVDPTVSEQTEYCYEVTFSDIDGVIGTNPQTVGPLTTPPCATDGTIISSTSAAASSCKQITVTSFFTGDDNGNGQTQVEYDDGGGFQVACATQTGPSPRQCIIPGLLASTSYPIRVTFSDVDGVTPDANLDANTEQVIPPESPVSTPACGGDEAAPTVLFLAPARDAVLGETDRIKVQVFDDGGLPASPLLWSVDGDALGTCPAPYCAAAVNVNPDYNCDWAGNNTCEVYQFDLDTTTLSNGAHYLTVQVTDSAGNVARLERPFQSRNDLTALTASGSGQLLRRTFGSQVCKDCHNLATHSSQLTDTGYGNWAMECLSCHTPHGVANIFLIREIIETPNSGPLPVRFEENTTGAVGDSSTPGTASFVNEDHVAETDGICQVCHTRTGGATPRWRNKQQPIPNSAAHYTALAGTQACTDCHVHADGFAGGGSCTGCHFTGGQAVDAGRRPVEVDFAKQSHHVGNGGSMGGTLTDYDCVVCHAEGTVVAGDISTTGFHNDSACNGGRPCIDLKNADDATGTPFSYDKQLLTDTLATVNDWSSGSVAWETETSTALDPFCLTCHDSDGATDAANQNVDEGCDPTPANNFLNPFCDGTVTNNYDQLDRTRVVDIASKVTAGAKDWGGLCNGGTNDRGACSFGGSECTGGGTCVDPGQCDVNSDTLYEWDLCLVDADCPSGSCINPSGRLNDGINDPPEGIYARHAIRGQADSVYGAQNIPNAYWNQTNFAWNDTSVMGCADCHTVDGANTTSGNAHGSDSEYLLKNDSGLAIEGDYTVDSTLADYSYICYRCHDWERYSLGQVRDHTDNAGDWAHTSSDSNGNPLLGAARRTTGNDGNFSGIACLNCHGGAPSDPPASPTDIVGFGAIHGTSEVFGVEEDPSPDHWRSRLAYRFTNGASLRYYDPLDWSAADFSCWTLGSADNWGACTQHGGGSRDYTRAFNRPISY
jgi:hypothetical protein